MSVSLQTSINVKCLSTRHPGAWLGPGTAAADYDGDGSWLDIFVVGDGGLPNALYHNNGDGTFTDVAAKAGVADTPRGRGCVWFDYNNDGWSDLYVTCAGPNYLFENNGDGTFTDVTDLAGGRRRETRHQPRHR